MPKKAPSKASTHAPVKHAGKTPPKGAPSKPKAAPKFGSGEAAAGWKKAKNAKPGGDFDAPEIEDGVYIATLTKAECGQKNGIDWMRLGFTVTSGEHDGYEGTELTIFHWLEARGEKTVEDKQAYLAKDIGRLGYDASEIGWADIPAWCKQVVSDAPSVRLSTKSGVSESTGKRYCNVRLEGSVEE